MVALKSGEVWFNRIWQPLSLVVVIFLAFKGFAREDKKSDSEQVIEYVDNRDNAIITEFKEEDAEIRAEMVKQEERFKESTKEIKDQIKESHDEYKEWTRLLMEK
jgi:hypothetical protein